MNYLLFITFGDQIIIIAIIYETEMIIIKVKKFFFIIVEMKI